MRSFSRRSYLTLTGTGFVCALAGCAETEAEFLVTDLQLIHQRGQANATYPDDVVVRVSIENTGPSAQEGTLELTLAYVPGGVEEPEQTWQKEDEVRISRGTSRTSDFVFEDAYVAGSDIFEEYEVDGEITQTDT